MRPALFDRSRLPSARTWLVLLVALVLTVTGLPFALAGDEAPVDELTSATAESAEGAADEAAAEPTEDPIVIPQEPASEAPVDDGEEEAPATEAPVEPAEETGGTESEITDEDPAADETVDEPALAPARAAAEVEALAAAPDGGDFSINWLASDPFSYSHVTGGGVYANGGRDTTVESLNGGDFACGDLVSYLAAISVDDSAATDPATLQFTTSFATLTSSESGIGHEQIVRAVINTGDPGMDGDASVVSLDRSTSGDDLIGVVTVDDLEAGEQIIVRIDVRLGCQTGGRNVGTIHASLLDIRVIAPTTEVVPGGNQTVPFKQDGVRRELIVTKDVVGIQPAGATYTVTVSCLKGDTALLTFTGDGTQSAGQIPEGDTCTVTETADGGADRTTVKVNAGAAQNGKTADIVIGASNEVTFTNTYLAPTITVGKTAQPASVTPGGTITYTITATNTAASPVAARDVVVTDDLDDDLAAVAATFSVAGGAAQPCTVGAGNTISCSVGNLAIGQSVVVTVTARATIASCGNVVNIASAAGSNFTAVQSPQVTVPVLCSPDINLLKTSSTANAVPGETFTYTITASNPATATAAATGVVISDNLADSLTGVTASYKVDGGAAQSCTVGAGNTVTCNVGTLAIGSSAVVTIQVTATPASCPSVANRAVVTGTNFADEQSNPVDVTVTCTPDLTIDKTASKSSVVPGEAWNYEITVASPSTATATSTGVVVTDNLHDGLLVARPTYSVNGGAAQQCDVVGAGNTIRCAVGDLAPGDSAVVTIAATATVASCGDVVNVALATATNIRDEVGSDPVTVEVVCEPALELDKTASAGTVDAGDDITYTITATNPSGTATATAQDVVITDDLDDDLTGVAGSVTNGATTTPCTVSAGNEISCDAGDIPIDGSAVVTITATTTEAACGVVTNVSEADGANFTTVTSPTVDVTVVCPPELEIVKSASAGTVTPGDDYTYTITATNNAGPTGSAAEDLVITDDLDDDLAAVSATFSVAGGANQPCDATGAGNTVRCAVGDLAIGESVDVTIDATATVAACGVVTNTSTATGTNFTTITSNSVDVTVDCAPALELDKTASAGTVDAGDDITYTITATNPSGTATATAQDVVISDDLDDDLTNVSATYAVDGGASQPCDPPGAGNVLRCAVGDLAIDSSAVVTIVATTTEAACGVVTNQSSAEGTNFTTVTSPTVDVTVVCPPVIEVVKSASAGTVDIGDDYTYTISTTNAAGPDGSTAENVVVTDDLDDDLAGVSAVFAVDGGAEQPCDPTGAGNTIRCAIGDLPIGSSADITIDATATVEACGSVTNVSTASGTNFTSVTSNVVDVLIPCPGLEPGISLVKTGSAPARGVGDLITYTYLITNTGETTLTDITLDDDILGVITLPKTTLAAGESMVATATHEITLGDVEDGEVVNVGTTTGRPPTGPPVEDEDDERIPIPQVPSILLEKTPNTDFAEVGDTVTYEYVITNTGNVRLRDITLVDDKIGTIVSVDDMLELAPGESTTVTADYTLTEADRVDEDGLEVVNVARASGLPPKGPPVNSEDRATVTIIPGAEFGALRVIKELDGDGSPAPDAEFAFLVECEFMPNETFTIGADGGTHVLDESLEVGTTCTATETRTAGAQATTVAVDDATPTAGRAAQVTIVEGMTTVTFVNTFGTRPIVPPEDPPETPDLPATGAALMLQLVVGLGALGLGGGMVRLSASAGRRRRSKLATWSTRL